MVTRLRKHKLALQLHKTPINSVSCSNYRKLFLSAKLKLYSGAPQKKHSDVRNIFNELKIQERDRERGTKGLTSLTIL